MVISIKSPRTVDEFDQKYPRSISELIKEFINYAENVEDLIEESVEDDEALKEIDPFIESLIIADDGLWFLTQVMLHKPNKKTFKKLSKACATMRDYWSMKISEGYYSKIYIEKLQRLEKTLFKLSKIFKELSKTKISEDIEQELTTQTQFGSKKDFLKRNMLEQLESLKKGLEEKKNKELIEKILKEWPEKTKLEPEDIKIASDKIIFSEAGDYLDKFEKHTKSGWDFADALIINGKFLDKFQKMNPSEEDYEKLEAILKKRKKQIKSLEWGQYGKELEEAINKLLNNLS